MKTRYYGIILYMDKNLYKRLFIGTLCIAIVLRFFFVFTFFNTHELYEDSPDYVEVASNIISGNGFTTGVSNQYHTATTGMPKVGHVGPGWPLIIAPFMFLGESGIIFVRLLNIILGTFSVFLTMIITHRFFESKKVVLLVGIMMSLHPYLIHYTGYLLTETISTFLFTLYVFIIAGDQKPRIWVISGMILGYLTLVRGSFLLYIFPSILTLIYLNSNNKLLRSYKKKMKMISLHTLSFILIIIPWTVRNYLVFDEIVITPTIGSGILVAQMGINSNANWSDEEKEQEKRKLLNKYWTPDNPSEEINDSNAFSKYGWELINSNLSGYIYVCLGNLKKFWNYNTGTIKGRNINRALSGLVNIWGKMMQFLILLGVVLLFYKKHWIGLMHLLLPIGYLTGLHTLLYGMKRYRLSVEPLVIIIACFGFYQLIMLSKQWFKNNQELKKEGAEK